MEEAYQFLIQKLKYHDKIIVGVSGGPDSMYLLNLLLKVKKSLDITIIVAHVNHNTNRPGQKEDEQFVKQFCIQNGILFESMTIKQYGDDNFHTEARTIRYQFFKELAQKYDVKYVATAHHGDDLMETILMRLVRGSTLKGYSGFSRVIEYSEYTLIRPLIHLTKEQIENYMKQNKLEYRTDSSNQKDIYTRNRFRKYILPRLKEEDISVHDKFYKFSEILLECSDYIAKQTKQQMEKVYTQNVLNISKFQTLEPILKKAVLHVIFEEIYQDDLMLITDKHMNLLLKLIESDKPNGMIHLPNNKQAIKSYDIITITTLSTEPDEYEIEINELVCLPGGKTIEKISSTPQNGNDICRLNSKEITLPIYVRNKKDGDKMTVKGMLGRKKVSDIFTDCKISQQKRNGYPVVCDSQDHILWLPGLKKSKFCKEKQEKYDIILKYYEEGGK